MCRYFRPIQRRADVLLPFTTTGTLGSFDVHATIHGGGLTGGSKSIPTALTNKGLIVVR